MGSAAALPAPAARCAVSATGVFRSGRALTDLCVEDPALVCACCHSCLGVSEQVDVYGRAFWGSRDLCGFRDKQPTPLIISKSLSVMGKPGCAACTASWRDLAELQGLWCKYHAPWMSQEGAGGPCISPKVLTATLATCVPSAEEMGCPGFC